MIPIFLIVLATIGVFLIIVSYIFSENEEDGSQNPGHRTKLGFLALLVINRSLALEYLVCEIRTRNEIAKKWIYDTWKYRILDLWWRFFESCYLYFILGVALVYVFYLIVVAIGECIVDLFLRCIRIKKIRRA